MTHRLERHANNHAAKAHAIAKRTPRFIANITEAYPDSPASSTPGTGGHSTSSPVERAHEAHTLTDLAVVDWQRYGVLSDEINKRLDEQLDITGRWNFDVGEGPHHQRHARPTTDEDWCASCLRIDWFNPRSRGDLCDWCYRYALANGTEHPPIVLLMKRRDGKTITENDVKHAKQTIVKRKRK